MLKALCKHMLAENAAASNVKSAPQTVPTDSPKALAHVVSEALIVGVPEARALAVTLALVVTKAEAKAGAKATKVCVVVETGLACTSTCS